MSMFSHAFETLETIRQMAFAYARISNVSRQIVENFEHVENVDVFVVLAILCWWTLAFGLHKFVFKKVFAVMYKLTFFAFVVFVSVHILGSWNDVKRFGALIQTEEFGRHVESEKSWNWRDVFKTSQ